MSAGVLFGDALVVAGGERSWKLLEPSWGWDELYAAAAALEVGTVFYLRAADDAGLEAEPPVTGSVSVTVTGSVPGEWRWRLSTPASFLCGPGAPGRVGGGAVDVVDVAADLSRMAGPFDALEARELVDALAALERLLGVPWSSSTGRTAERLILSTHPRARGGTLLDRAPVTPAPVLAGNLEIPWVAWRRPLSADERALPPAAWLHVFDQNAQYLAAWITAELGHGTPVLSTAPRFDARTVGFWRVPGLDALELPFGELLPRPWIPGREWYSTATLARVLEVAHGLDVPAPAEAWLWPQRTRFLRGAGEKIRDARAKAELEQRKTAAAMTDETVDVDDAVRRNVIAGVALEAVKGLYRVQTGRFAMVRDGASAWARPDWAHTLRAQARVNLHRRLSKLGAAPFAIATDGLIFATAEPDPVAFAARIGLPIGDGLGEFHHAGSAFAGVVDLDVDGGLEGARVGALMQSIGKVMTDA